MFHDIVFLCAYIRLPVMADDHDESIAVWFHRMNVLLLPWYPRSIWIGVMKLFQFIYHVAFIGMACFVGCS